jgi:hypothetical protein
MFYWFTPCALRCPAVPIRIFVWRNVVSEDKKRGNLTRRVHKAKSGGPQKLGLPGEKKGDRENLSPVCGGYSEYEDPSTRAWGAGIRNSINN